MTVVIIKYPAGNVQSVILALKRLGVHPLLSDQKEVIKSADKIILPGVGEAKSAMRYLRKKGLHEILPSLKQPILGICLGMQLLCNFSEENDTICLGVFDINVKKFNTFIYKVPQIGWNTLFNLKGKLFEEMGENPFQYFVHSYYVPNSLYTIACSRYTCIFSAALQKYNFYATQFHPEKSSFEGQKILKNFIKL
ncbi:imidazole glycerol phosphate synthase subunit HisH [Candidatus Uzinura diaspidicola str. ASNER]|uniref:Imidazole glycerol phosphate synthase subunit HisH n=1 Tax=Candidatus Uzinura diaspidicola str. ASNER TaxID=1133592 RepID=L7VJE5_9FLAO|nr:imidazole glycerol phosphate synthase subunit HisH [Candidatus Uzinura diaspidicola str. ASNER]